jgi:hypothetical protein
MRRDTIFSTRLTILFLSFGARKSFSHSRAQNYLVLISRPSLQVDVTTPYKNNELSDEEDELTFLPSTIIPDSNHVHPSAQCKFIQIRI